MNEDEIMKMGLELAGARQELKEVKRECEQVGGSLEHWYQSCRALVALVVHRHGAMVAERLVERVEQLARDGFDGESCHAVDLCDPVAGRLMLRLTAVDEARRDEEEPEG